MPDLVTGPDGRRRCAWSGDDPLYVAYHDDEWGRPVRDDRGLYEKLCLEGFQAGLSWLTILRKREAFRAAFAGFFIDRVAAFDDGDVDRLLANPAIVRNQAKIEATIANARAAKALIDADVSFADFVWSFAPADASVPKRLTDVPAATAESTALSKALKRRGFRFVGPTTCYAFMQSMGLVNDHLSACHAR